MRLASVFVIYKNESIQVRPHHFRGIVARSAIHNNVLNLWIVLREYTLNRFLDEVGVIIRRRYNTN